MSWSLMIEVAVLLFSLSMVQARSASAISEANEPAPFKSDQRDTLKSPWVRPWRIIEMDPDFSGQWLVADDLDGDGQVEFVAARNAEQAVTAMSAYEIDGTVLWRWGKAGAGSAQLSYDVPVQIYDVDGNGSKEVVFSIEGSLVLAEGATGREIRRVPLPEGLRVADCIVLANLTGRRRAEDIIIKDRYERIWAFTRDFQPLWRVEKPGGFRTCHHPELVDIDGDGRDEVVVGYTLVDDDGSELWTAESLAADLREGHLDCCRVVRRGEKPEDFRFVLTYCGADAVAVVDGTGRLIWETGGYHFESADVGDVRRDVPGREIVVDIDHRPYGASLTVIFGEEGQVLGSILSNYGRHHDLVDWDGDGVDEIVLGHARALCDGKGQRLATFAPENVSELGPPGRGDPEPFVFVGDVTGDRREDVVLHTSDRIEIYRNPPCGGPPRTEPRIGTGPNYTLY